MERRDLIRAAAAMTAVGIAGCSGGTAHRLDGEVWDGVDREDTELAVVLSGEVTLEEGAYAIRDIDPDEESVVDVDFEVIDGGPIDVMFLTRSEYEDRYRDGESEEVQFLDQLTAVDSSGTTLSHEVSAGEYVLVLDNTGVYGASPDGPTTVELEVQIRRPTDEVIDAALGHVDAAGAEIERQADVETSDFDAAAVHAELEDAMALLDLVEGQATEDERAVIGELRTVIAWYGHLGDAFAALDAGLTEFDTAVSLFEAERYEDSDDSLDTVQDHLADAETALEDASGAHARYDPSAIEEIDADTAASAMETLSAYVTTMQGFTEGYRDLLHGFQSFFDGAEHYDDEEWGEAVGPLRAAQEDFERGEATMRDTEDNAPPEIVGSMVELTCQAGAMRDASEHFANAAQAAMNGRTSEFQEEDAAARDAFDRC